MAANDMKMAERTYNGFVSLLKWVVPITALTIFIVILLIA